MVVIEVTLKLPAIFSNISWEQRRIFFSSCHERGTEENFWVPVRKDLEKEEARCVTSQRKAAKEIILLETRLLTILAKYYALINFSGLVPITTVLKLLIKLKPKSIQNEANVEGKNPDNKLSNLFEDYLNMDKRVIVYQYQPRIIPSSPQLCSFQVNMERNY